MMKYYIDITLLPGAEDSLGFLWQKVYQQVHLGIVENKTAGGNSAVAVSFPKYGDKNFPLGDKLRLFSAIEEKLQELDIGKWLNRLHDYTHVTSIKEIPQSGTKFVCFSRKQFNTNIERLARRRVKRKGGSFEEALKHYANFQDKKSELPFINVNSLHSGGKFRLFIEQSKEQKPVEGEFSCYGLSKTATVPWF